MKNIGLINGIHQISLTIGRGKSVTVYQKTDNAMAKRNRRKTKMVDKI